MSLLPSKFGTLHLNLHRPIPIPIPQFQSPPSNLRRTLRVFNSKRSGKQRYPSERKQLKLKHREFVGNLNNQNNTEKFQGVWRLSKLGVSVYDDPGKDFIGVSQSLLDEIAKLLRFPVASMLPPKAFTVIRKSFDARKRLKEPRFVYIVEMDVDKLLDLEPRAWDFISEMEPKAGLVERVVQARNPGDLTTIIHDLEKLDKGSESREGTMLNGSQGSSTFPTARKPKIAVVGSGPSGLFASLVLAEFGADVTLIERGQPVEQRGRDIGALVARRILQTESNFCFGEVPGVMENW